jgi:hypothetical protein
MASFADYVKDLMGVLPQVNGNPMLSATSMTDDNARYREDPFYISRGIQARDQLVLDEEERRSREAALSGSGMMTGGGEGGEGGAPALSKDQESFFSWMESTPEGQAFKDQRGQQIGNLIGLVSPFGGVRAAMNGLPTFNTDTLFGIPQDARNWQEQQRMQTPAYRDDAIRAINRESVINQQKKFEDQNVAALANSGWNSDRSSYTSSYGTTTDSGSISPAQAAGLDAARETYGYGSNADYYGD